MRGNRALLVLRGLRHLRSAPSSVPRIPPIPALTDEVLPREPKPHRYFDWPELLEGKSHPALEKLVALGLDLHATLRLGDAADILYKLDSERDLLPRLDFLLHTVGLPITELGQWLGANPWIFRQSLDDLRARYNYLRSKRFSKSLASELILASPVWLNMPVAIVDDRLGYLQQEFGLKGDEVRAMAVAAPKLIIAGKGPLKLIKFCLLEQLGFNLREMRRMAIRDPLLWTVERELIEKNFQYLHYTIGLSHRRMAMEPAVLRAKSSLLRLRHEFLVRLGRDQYDPERPNYVQVSDLLRPHDADFAVNVAKSSEADYDNHLKSD